MPTNGFTFSYILMAPVSFLCALWKFFVFRFTSGTWTMTPEASLPANCSQHDRGNHDHSDGYTLNRTTSPHRIAPMFLLARQSSPMATAEVADLWRSGRTTLATCPSPADLIDVIDNVLQILEFNDHDITTSPCVGIGLQ
jgi:hypothetical protein